MTKKKTAINIAPREKPAIYSMGFRFGMSNDGICIIDFIDAPEKDIQKISFSVAVTKKQAESIVDGLNNFIDKEQ